MADNVKEYVEQNPFGQGAITKLHKQWNFYCKIVAVADEPAAKWQGNTTLSSNAEHREPWEKGIF